MIKLIEPRPLIIPASILAVNKSPIMKSATAIMSLVLLMTASAAGHVVRWIHGINDSCHDDIASIKRLLPDFDVQCVETSRGQIGSLAHEIAKGCQELEKESEHLASGFTLVGMSQGGLIARAILQTCSVGKFVRRLLTYGSPHNGVALIPHTKPDDWINTIAVPMCYLQLFELGVGPCGYMRSLRFFSKYLNSGITLLDINNEKTINQAYKERIQSLDLLMTVEFEKDTMVQPRTSGTFGFFKDASYSSVGEMEEQELFKEDRLGLRLLEESGRLFRCRIPADHLQFEPIHLQRFLVDFANTGSREYQNHLDYLRNMCRFQESRAAEVIL